MSTFGTTAGTSGGLFGGSNSTASGPSNTPTNQPSLFGTKPPNSGGLFGGAQNTGSSGETNSNTTGLFGGGSIPPSTNIFGSTGNMSAGAAVPSLSGNAGAASAGHGATSSNIVFGGSLTQKPADQNATNAPKPTGASLFGQQASTSNGNPAAAAPVGGGGLFGQPAKAADSTSGAATPSTNLFGGSLFGTSSGLGTSTSTVTNTVAPTATSSNLSLGLKGEKDGAPTPAPALNLFGTKLTEEKKDAGATTGAPASPFSLGLTKPAGVNVSSNQAPATLAVAVAPPSMLRGKTIEEIVNKWSTELEAHVREFNKFASEVAVWDRALIENGNNLSTLYSHVLSAERDQSDIDQSLDHIEQQQKELASTLDAYEKVTQEMIGTQGGSLRALDTGPADTERDKNYMLATDLHIHLDDLSDSLTQMIESVNVMSSKSNDSTSAAEDPMGQIAQILSSHLESLQWIDGAVREVESKVEEVERRTKDSKYTTATNPKATSFGLNR